MRLVKLDAIDSTNNYLKELIRSEEVENFTIISAVEQTQGRGQMGSSWVSEKGKNIIMSVLVKDFLVNAEQVFDLNIAFSLAVLSVLKKHQIPDLAVKWPNDIMSGNKKIGGILIENSFKSNGDIQSVIGLGLNVHQTNFNQLPQATSLFVVAGRDFDLDILIFEMVSELKSIINHWPLMRENYRAQYTADLFKLNQKMEFKKVDETQFEGSIIGINQFGKILIKNQDDIFDYDIKEIQMIY